MTNQATKTQNVNNYLNNKAKLMEILRQENGHRECWTLVHLKRVGFYTKAMMIANTK